MLRRLSVLVALLSVVAAGGAPAATIDPGLAQELSAKGAAEFVDVLLLMEQPADLQALEAELIGASPEQRRAAVVAALRAHADEVQIAPMRVLDAAVRTGDAEGVRVLWLANAIAFRGNARAVQALAADKTPAALIHDKAYDMISGVKAPSSPAALAAAERAAAVPPAAALTGAGLAAVPTDTAWGVRWVRATRVWRDTGYMGQGVLVGHFDTGVWLTHPDIANRLYVNPGEIPGNGIDDDGNGYIDDVNGYDFGNQDSNPNDDTAGSASNHGTHTAGTVAGDGTNGTVTGVAPRASILVCKVFRSDGSGAPFSAIYEGQQYAITMGARIFTMSLGIGGVLPASLMRTERENADAIRAAGVAFFNSAGNDYGTYTAPNMLGVTARVPAPWNPIASTPYSSRGGVIAVGGTGYQSNTVYFYSSRGPAAWGDVAPFNDWPYPPGLIKPDVVAPGQNINSLQKPSSYSGNTWSGTSMSCPHAAGVAALLLEKNPTLSPAGIDSILEQTAVPLGTPGKDNTFGSGQLDALAAINATPAAQRPHLVPTGLIANDTNSDGVLDPGETVDIIFELTNNSLVLDAVNVVGGLAVAANPHVSVIDAAGTFPDIPLGGGTGSNAGNVFTLQIAPGAPQGYVFTMLLTVTADTGYQVTFDRKLAVGLPDHRQHAVGEVQGTVTDQGSIGYMDDTQAAGTGFGWRDEGSVLFVGSFWGGNGQAYICNRDYSGLGAGTTVETYEWQTVTSPNGRVQVLTPGAADQEFLAIFNDSGHASPRNIVVTQHSYAWADPGYDDFIILSYTVRNDGVTTVTDYHGGVFVDWDIGNAGANWGATDPARHLTYMYETTSGPYAGIALLYPHTHKNLTLISNPTYVYPEASIDDGIKARHLRNLMSLATTPSADDWSALTSAGGFDIAPGQEVKFVFALVMGENLADLQANTDAAQMMYYTTPVAENQPPMPLDLGQNRPNPFNPSTTILFTVEREGPVAIAVYDLAGRKVRTLTDQSYAPGRHSVVWDGASDTGERMPSGMYLYRLETEGRSLTRKMMLVK